MTIPVLVYKTILIRDVRTWVADKTAPDRRNVRFGYRTRA